MKKPRRILVAIKNPGSRAQPALRKAAQLALALDARLEIFHAISEPVYLDAFLLEGLTLEQTQKQWRDRLVKKLERHAQHCAPRAGRRCRPANGISRPTRR